MLFVYENLCLRFEICCVSFWFGTAVAPLTPRNIWLIATPYNGCDYLSMLCWLIHICKGCPLVYIFPWVIWWLYLWLTNLSLSSGELVRIEESQKVTPYLNTRRIYRHCVGCFELLALINNMLLEINDNQWKYGETITISGVHSCVCRWRGAVSCYNICRCVDYHFFVKCIHVKGPCNYHACVFNSHSVQSGGLYFWDSHDPEQVS